MSEHYWGWMIVVYLFLGGLGAGCFAMSGAAYLSGRGEFRRIARAGALAAPVLVGLGSGLLVFDLGSPFKAWRLFVHLNPVSPMSVGTWLLTIFLALSTAHAVLNIPPVWIRKLRDRLGRRFDWLEPLERWNRSGEALTAPLFPEAPEAVRKIRRTLGMLAIPLGIAVGIYTGVLLSAIPARPFWNTPIVAQLFLFSALSTSTALLMLIAPVFWRDGISSWDAEHRALLRADLMFIVLELFIIAPFVIHGQLSVLSTREALKLILGGPYGWMFWIGVVLLGLLIPMILEALQLTGALRRAPAAFSRVVRFAAPALILVGGYLVRWILVHAGQDSEFL